MNNTGAEPLTIEPAKASEMDMLGLLEVARALQERVDLALEGLGLSMAKYMALVHLAEAGGSASLSTLAENRKCVRSNITQLVDRLVADGSVARVNDPDDRRAVRAQITELGARRLQDANAAMRAIHADLAGRVSDGERTNFLKVLSTLKCS